jgi:hypothetical protein
LRYARQQGKDRNIKGSRKAVIFTEEQVKAIKRKIVETRRNAEDRRDDVKRRQTYQGTPAPDREVLDTPDVDS